MHEYWSSSKFEGYMSAKDFYVKSAEGLKLEALYYPFWISGDLKASMVENDMATAAYSMEMNNYEAYQQE